MPRTVLVTGGAGYIGAGLCRALRGSGHTVRVLDALIHGNDDLGAALDREGVEVIQADLRDATARRAALRGIDAVVHLAAIVGDPACARDPELSEAVNVGASNDLIDDARASGVARFVMASTCSNYGRMADPTIPIGEDGELRPVSAYARHKVAIERRLLADDLGAMSATCLRFATIYGAAARMRFDLTVNEFTRDLWAGLELEVFGEHFWRPYVHVADAARAVQLVLDADRSLIDGEVFNVGDTSENYTKRDIVTAIEAEIARGTVRYVHRDEDPRDYRVSFEKVRSVLGFEPTMTVPDGIREMLGALDARAFGDPFDARFRNTP